MHGPAGRNLLQLLERRLDNVVYKLGWGRTRPMARQLVGYGHVEVNGRRVTIPYRVKPGDVIHLGESGTEIPVVQEEMMAAGRRAGVVSVCSVFSIMFSPLAVITAVKT